MSQVQPPLLPAVRRRRSNRIALALLVVLFGIPLAVFLFWRINLAREVKALEQRVRQEGDPLTLAEVASSRPKVPAAENAAEALMELWTEADPGFWVPFRDGLRPDTTLNRDPIPSALLIRKPREGVLLRTLPWTEEQVRVARNTVAGQAERPQRVLGALQRKDVEFPVLYEEGLNALLPLIAEIKHETMLLQIAAQLAIHDKDVPVALVTMAGMANLGDVLRNEPLVISQIVRADCFGSVLNTAQQLLSHSELNTADIEVLDRLFVRMELGNAYEMALVTKRTFALSIFDSRMRDLDSLSSGGGSIAGGGGFLGSLRLEGFPLGLSGYFAKDRRFLLAAMEEAVTSARTGTVEGILDAVLHLKAAAARARTKPYRIVSGMVLPGTARAGEQLVEYEIRRRCGRAALAVERHAQSHEGEWPAALEDCLTEGEGEWLDPFVAEPLRYLRRKGGYVIYSVGPDYEDDSGALVPQAGRRRGADMGFEVQKEE
jgi:hypothetical protein